MAHHGQDLSLTLISQLRVGTGCLSCCCGRWKDRLGFPVRPPCTWCTLYRWLRHGSDVTLFQPYIEWTSDLDWKSQFPAHFYQPNTFPQINFLKLAKAWQWLPHFFFLKCESGKRIFLVFFQNNSRLNCTDCTQASFPLNECHLNTGAARCYFCTIGNDQPKL